MSYYIEPEAYVPLMPHGNSKFNQNVYIRKRPSEVKRRTKKAVLKGSNSSGIKPSDPISLALSEADVFSSFFMKQFYTFLILSFVNMNSFS